MTKISDSTFKNQVKILEKYAKEKMGYKILYKNIESCECQYNKKIIVMDSKLNPESTFYLLLHELGHAKLCRQKKSYGEKYEQIYNSFSRKSFIYKTTILQEELDAWQEGIIISKRLELKVDKRRFEMRKTKCIMSYVRWIE